MDKDLLDLLDRFEDGQPDERSDLPALPPATLPLPPFDDDLPF